jgi:hypothetical protein
MCSGGAVLVSIRSYASTKNNIGYAQSMVE